MALNRYRLLSFDHQMGIGVADARQVTVSAVAKTNSDNAPYCVPNELICGELGRFLRLPIPPCGVFRTSQAQSSYWFASMDFNLTGNSLPPVDPQRCVKELPHECTGLLLFDVLVGNCDRHRRNFAMDSSTNPPQMSVFDHSHALFGYVHGKGADRLAALRDRLGISWSEHGREHRHCLLDVISTDDYFDEWITRLKALPDYLIDGLCNDAAETGVSADEAGKAAVFLKHRRANMRRIIDDNQAEFRGIKTWRLPL
jgi:hypothetical protein